MIFGKLIIKDAVLHTHRDSFILEGIKKVSIHRPFLSTGVMVASLTGLFVVGFADILYPGELLLLGSVASLSMVLGLSLAQLRLISRDLGMNEASDALYGTYAHLNRERLKISAAVDQVKSGGAS
ncbi:MAG: hypothetical protein R3D56_11660 [Paracoccaceae bacterium]